MGFIKKTNAESFEAVKAEDIDPRLKDTDKLIASKVKPTLDKLKP